jgi:multicomponent Na+:H+ antiporter subunit A
MIGVAPTLGFIAKDSAYEALLGPGHWSVWLLSATVFSSVLMGTAGLMAGVLPFHGPRSDYDGHEPGWRLLLPPMTLAATGVVAGLAPWLLNASLTAAAGAILNRPQTFSLAIWHGFSPALMLSALTFVGVVTVYLLRDAVRKRTWRPVFGTEHLYSRTVSILDTISRIIGPPLHSAPLRSYVMVIVVSTMAAGFAALSTLPTIRLAARTDVRTHELLIVVVIIAGAIAATLAKSTMAAVLSLGVVGYGIAMTFLLYGAPDLAMTQFSVETLTVIIYVLVFRHFRNLGPLSPPLVRYRDMIIGGGIGTFIGVLVLSISTTDTAARLREYFVQFGPTLGHGRNIVNVILVDFRGFDTMGEITVLATVAIGVRALIRLAKVDTGDSSTAASTAASPIFRTAARMLMPLLLLFAAFLLWRGHNEPGGGFVGGLVAAAAFSLYLMAFGVGRARRALFVTPMTLLGVGLLVALVSSLPAAVLGRPFLSAQWVVEPLTLGTPMIFDIGVFLVVTGVVLMMIFSLAEESS